MTNNQDLVQVEYNKYQNLPLLSYNIISYLIDNNDLIFKLLKYDDSYAFNKANLTLQEKIDLVYKGQIDTNSYRIFLDFGSDASILSESTMLRISPLEVLPSNYVYGWTTMAFEVYSHFKTNTMANYQTKVDTIVQQLLETLNGADIQDVGRLVFDPKMRNRITVLGSIPIKGKLLTLCNYSLK